MPPKVTVLLTSYNHSQFIEDSINSVLNQTYPDFELIILDDHSTDSSWEIIQTYSDNRIRAIRNERNLGNCYIKDAIKDFSLCDFIAIHHSDDIWEPTKLEKQINSFKNHPECAALFSHAKIINESGEDFGDTHHYYYSIFDQPNRSRYQWLRLFFLHGNVICNPSALIRKKPFLNLVTLKGLFQLSDLSMWVQLCLKYEIYIIQQKLVKFRVRNDEANMSGNCPDTRIRHRYELIKIMDHYRHIPSAEDLLRIFPEAKAFIHPKNKDILYALGRVAVEISPDKPVQLFGLNLLYDALNDQLRASALEKYNHFNLKEFIKLTAKMDIYSLEANNKLAQELEQIKDRESYYSQSRSWRFTEPGRRLMSLWRKFLKNK